MQGDYSANSGARPRLLCTPEGDACSDDRPARLLVCVRCQAQALVCRFCDRGQVYCAAACAQSARRRTLRESGKRYQSSHRGRRAHAERTARWRRQKNVTHHGSPPPGADDLLPPGSPEDASDAAAPADRSGQTALHCHWCGRRCPDFVRQGFLRRRTLRRRQQPRDQRGSKHGDVA
jgi:hypothetical protein